MTLRLLASAARCSGSMPRRIALAQRLIRAGCDLAEVAVRAGFYDQSHLTRWFVRQFGVTPSRYCVVAR
jgi:AraC-like DNA-binding protein